MKVIVLGAGVAGVTAAHALAARGHEVEVIEREGAAAMQTSFANGGQLSYTHALPWANAEALPNILKWMFRDDAPLVLRFSTDPHMIRWGLRFLANCTHKQAEKTTIVMLRLGLYARRKLAAIVEDTGIAFDHRKSGILHVFTDPKALEDAERQSRFQETHGGAEALLDRAGCVALEPALKDSARPIVGGLYSAIDESGDLHAFTQHLAAACTEKYGTRFRYGAKVDRLEKQGGRLSAVVVDGRRESADAVVMALGPQSAGLLRTVGIDLPIYPMKGYSVTLPAWEGAPEVSITDDQKKVVVSRLGARVRAAGTAEFARYDSSIRESRIQPILQCISELFPAADVSNPMKWACLRPQTPDGPPIVGRSKLENLFLHTGHGTLGWTQSAGTAQVLADVMEGRTPEIELSGITFDRY